MFMLMTNNKKRVGIFWFTNDVRLHDNPALMRASKLVNELSCVYVYDRSWQSSSYYAQPVSSNAARTFLDQSLNELASRLDALGQHLAIAHTETIRYLTQLIEHTKATDIFRSDHVGWYENRAWQVLRDAHPNVVFHLIPSYTLFTKNQLPFPIEDLPLSFTQFKKQISHCTYTNPIATVIRLPPPPERADKKQVNRSHTPFTTSRLQGGEHAGLAHLQSYFSSNKPSYYKEVRNSIDGWDNSSKLSLWLANGCLSVRQVATQLSEYEHHIERNKSTYWIYFELLWREYFQWYAFKHGRRLYAFTGIKSRSPLTSFYPERFKKWVMGTTPYPIVNACMNELRATGYLSNRGRQIVASCLVNELSIDWRYGAAYFEQVLIDYDVASNWGNWQYLAGVGADVRDKRHFNLEKQTQQFDPKGRYISLWNGEIKAHSLDSLDAAGWPIT